MEPEFTTQNRGRKGWIEVICGSMFSGKTEELIRRLRRARIAGMQTEVFKPVIDQRYDHQQIVSHDESVFQSTPVPSSSNIMLLGLGVNVIGIDEAQFFDDQLPYVCEKLAESGARVIVAGLDMDFAGRPFGPMPHLMAVADYVSKLHAVCVHCKDLATHSHRIVPGEALIMIGEKETYIPLCRSCFNEEIKSDELNQSSYSR